MSNVIKEDFNQKAETSFLRKVLDNQPYWVNGTTWRNYFPRANVNFHHPFTVIPHNKPRLVFRIQNGSWSNRLKAELISKANKQRLTINFVSKKYANARWLNTAVLLQRFVEITQSFVILWQKSSPRASRGHWGLNSSVFQVIIKHAKGRVFCWAKNVSLQRPDILLATEKKDFSVFVSGQLSPEQCQLNSYQLHLC